MWVSMRMPKPPGILKRVTTPGEGAKVSGSPALIRASKALPWQATSAWAKESGWPCATRMASRTMSMPVVSSVIGCSTCAGVHLDEGEDPGLEQELKVPAPS